MTTVKGLFILINVVAGTPLNTGKVNIMTTAAAFFTTLTEDV